MDKFRKAVGWLGAAMLAVSQAMPMPPTWQAALVGAGGSMTWFAKSPYDWKPGLPHPPARKDGVK